MRVYLDDRRATPEGWVGCRWPTEVIELLKTGNVTYLSLDHDLGDKEAALTEDRKEITGYDVIEWLEGQAHQNIFYDLDVQIHSDNSVGIARMKRGLAQIQKLKKGS